MGITWGSTDTSRRTATPDYAALCDGDTSDTDEPRLLTAGDLDALCGLARAYRATHDDATGRRLAAYAPALLDTLLEYQMRLDCLEAEHSARGCGLAGALILAAAIYVAGMALGLWLR